MHGLLLSGRRWHLRRAASFLVSMTVAALAVSATTVGATAGPAYGSANDAGVPSAAKGTGKGPVISSAAKHDTSPKLRSLKPAPAAHPGEVPLYPVPHGKAKTSGSTGTAAVQTTGTVTTNAMPGFGQNFEGVGNVSKVLPPDTQGDVGPNNYVQMVNMSVTVWDKQGNRLYGPVPNSTLWQGFGGPCETSNGGDPVTMYDEQAGRWFMSQLAYPQLTSGSGGFHQCIAISTTGDPLGAWYRYDFLISNDTMNDYPKFGVWNDAYYASANDFLNGSFTGVTVQAYERAEMLKGQPARLVSFHIGDSSGIYGSLLPADAEGQALGFSPPPGAPEQFFQFDDAAWGFSPTDRILSWDFHTDWTNPANSTFGVSGTPNRYFETAPFDSNLCNYARTCITQPGTPVRLGSLSDRLMFRAAYRNLGDHQGIALSHTVDVDGLDHAGVRWYRLDDPGSGWTLADQGTYAPDSDNRWMPSAALDASGDLAVGYSVSSSSTYPSIRVAGRLAGDPAGQLSQGEQTMIAGGGSQTHPAGRWGDYSDIQVDPTDGCTFWYTTEYLPQTSISDWHTRIGSFRFPSCTTGPHGTLTGTVTDASTGKPIAGASVSTPVATTTTDAQGHYALVLPADPYDVTFSAYGYTSKTENGVQINDGATATLGEALSPKAGWGKVQGTVTGVDCSGTRQPMSAELSASGRNYSFTLQAGPSGTYAFPAPAVANPITLSVSKSGWFTQSKVAYINVGGTTTLDFDLPKVGCGSWFEPVGFLHPFPTEMESASMGLSPDGSVAVGRDLSRVGYEATRWTRTDGLSGLGDIPGSPTLNSYAAGASNNGVIVGTGAFGTDQQRAFRWTKATGMVALDVLPGTTKGYGSAVSKDGSVIVGYSASSDLQVQHPFLWTTANTMTDLGLPPGYHNAAARDVSAAGEVVVGDGFLTSGGLGAWRWTKTDGFTTLGTLGGPFPFTRASGISGDGRVIIGNGASPNGFEAFRWTADGGMAGLGDLPGGTYSSWANGGVSYDGSIIVGGSQSSDYAADAFVWDPIHSMRSLKHLLQDQYALDLSGWNLEEAQGLSADGRTISGWGYNPLGQREAWVAHIPDPTITLTATTRANAPDLTWTGAVSAYVDIYRDGKVVATVTNSGSYTDSTGATGTHTYKVCEPAVQNCSNDVTR